MTLPPDWIVPDWPAPPRVRALITSRSGGTSRGPYASFNLAAHVGDDPLAVARNRDALRQFLPADPVWMKQVHATRIIAADPQAREEEADGAVAHAPGRVCAVLTADCLSVLLADEAGSAVGIAHAGWRGLAAGVVENAVRAMQVSCASLIAYLGPAIGAQVYEVGAEVRDAFAAGDPPALRAFAPRPGGKFLADLAMLARQRLARAGVSRVFGGTHCTYSDSRRFYSYRREGATGRMASLIWLE